MKMRSLCLALAFLWMPCAHGATIIDLGDAAFYSVLAGSTVTNTGATTLHGNLGLSPGTAVTGFPPGMLNGGTIQAATAAALLAKNSLTSAYNFGASQSCGSNLTGQNLGGLSLTPGVYCFDSSALLTGTLTLNSLNNPNAVFIFQMGSTLTTGSDSTVIFANGVTTGNIFWQVGSSATLGTHSLFQGNILAQTSITLTTGANIACGRALASTGAVTLDTNDISALGCSAAIIPPDTPPDTPPIIPDTGPGPAATVPEPGTILILSIGFLGLIVYRRKMGSSLVN